MNDSTSAICAVASPSPAGPFHTISRSPSSASAMRAPASTAFQNSCDVPFGTTAILKRFALPFGARRQVTASMHASTMSVRGANLMWARILAVAISYALVRVWLFITCLADQIYPDVGATTVRVLRRLGCSVDFPRAQTCCGQPPFNGGFREEARAIARHMIDVFEASEHIVAPSGSCVAMVK